MTYNMDLPILSISSRITSLLLGNPGLSLLGSKSGYSLRSHPHYSDNDGDLRIEDLCRVITGRRGISAGPASSRS